MDKIICVGKNYEDHARELGDVVPEKPVLFLKPPSAVVDASGSGLIQVPLPQGRGEVHHECEIILKLGAQGRIEAVTLGLDLTLRDLQSALKKKGHPWEVSKAFPHSAVVGPWISLKDFPQYLDTVFEFSVDGKVRQRGLGKDMVLSPTQCIEYAGENFQVLPGDLLFTGTPAGVGPLLPGQRGRMTWNDRLSVELKF